MATSTPNPNYIRGDVTEPVGRGPRIVAHCCNDVGLFGAGVALAIRMRWPRAAEQYILWSRGELLGPDGDPVPPPSLGQIQLVRVEEEVWVANMIGQHGVRSRQNQRPIDYGALEQCLAKLAEKAIVKFASVHMPRIGAGLAGGKWSRIEPLIASTLVERGVPVTIYDFD